MSPRSIFRLIALLATPLFAGCAYQPGDTASPLTRKITWLSYVAGDDLRLSCGPGSPDRFRLVYNGRWDEQVRVYELGISGPQKLDQRVIGPGDLLSISLGDPFGPWRGTTASITLRPDDYEGLLHALEASGAYASPSATLTLPSDRFYWIAASCHGGQFHLTGWLYPSQEFAAVTFAVRLAALDTTGVAFNPPRPWTVPVVPSLRVDPYRYRLASSWSIGIAHDRLVDELPF